jgi:elongator complex protein 4
MELLFDSVIELVPLQQPTHVGESFVGGGKSQGLVRVHTLPTFHEKGGGMEGCWNREDMSFWLSASHGLVITPLSLPPVGLDEDPDATSILEKPSKQDLDF